MHLLDTLPDTHLLEIAKIGHMRPWYKQMFSCLSRFWLNNTALIWTVLFSCFLFLPAVNSFFSGDDWFHLQVVQIDSFSEFLQFFNPVFNPQSTAFFRPLPNQLFFYTFFQLFGFWALPYYLFLLSLFAASVLLFSLVLKRVGFSSTITSWATFLFATSQTHFTRLNFLSAGQEVMMSVFFLLALLSDQIGSVNLKQHRWIDSLRTGGLFFLALLCKDNALVFPVFVLALNWIQHKKIFWKKMSVLAVVSSVYLWIRFVLFHSPLIAIDAYALNFSPKLAVNTLYFYGIWALGAPELLQDYLSSPLSVIDRYFTDFPTMGLPLLLLLLTSGILTGVSFLLSKNKRLALGCLVLFVCALGPVLFLPQHKFTMQMSVSLMCFSVFLALLLEKKKRWMQVIILSVILILNVTSLSLTQRTHYTGQRSEISRKVFSFFSTNYPSYPENSYFVFQNSSTPGSSVEGWGSSRQISYALWGNFFAQVFYGDPTLVMYYEDIPASFPTDKKAIWLDSTTFLGNE